MCPPVRAHWRHLANMIELVHPSAHSSPQPKWQMNRLSCFCTGHRRNCLYFTMGAPIYQNCRFPWWFWTPTNTWFFWPYTSPKPKLHLHWFSCFCTDDRRVSLYFTMICPFPAQNGLFTWGRSGLHVIYRSLEPPESLAQTATRSFLPFWKGSCEPNT